MDRLFDLTIGQFFEEAVEKHAHNPAVKFPEVGYERTYAELNEEVDRIAKGLLGLGFRNGDHLAIWTINRPEWIVLFLATAKIGIVLVPVNTYFRAQELQYLLKQSDCRALITSDGLKNNNYVQVINDICPELKSSKPGFLFSGEFPLLRMIISFDSDQEGMYRWSQIEKFGHLISDNDYEELKSIVLPDDVSRIIYTSGTTGFPKGAMLTHKMLVNNAFSGAARIRYNKSDRICHSLPFFHSFGLTSGILHPMVEGSLNIALTHFSPLLFLETIEKEKVTTIIGVPAMLNAILYHPDLGKYDYSSLVNACMSGSPIVPQLFDELTEKMSLKRLANGYGLTECSPGCCYCSPYAPLEKRRETMGTAMDFVEMKIIDPNTGVKLPAGKQGEICVRGFNVMKGYYRMPEATKQIIDNENWLHTGDLGIVDEDGYYTITGRMKDLIIRGGENIYPQELEEFILSHPAVREVQIVSVPSEKYSEEVFAFIIPQKGALVTHEDIKQYVAENMARFKVPSYVAFVEQMPMTATGKVQKFRLREMAKEYISEI